MGGVWGVSRGGGRLGRGFIRGRGLFSFDEGCGVVLR